MKVIISIEPDIEKYEFQLDQFKINETVKIFGAIRINSPHYDNSLAGKTIIYLTVYIDISSQFCC